MVSALQPFFQTKVEPCTLKLKLCLEIGYPLKWVPEYHLFNCTHEGTIKLYFLLKIHVDFIEI